MRIINPPLKLTNEIFSFIYDCSKRGKEVSEENIKQYFKKTPSYLQKSIDFLVENGLVKREKEIILIDKSKLKELKTNSFSILTKEALSENLAFIEYSYFISQGLNKAESAKRVKFIYDIDGELDSLAKTFDSWANFIGVKLEKDTLKDEGLELLEISVGHRLNASKFLKHFLGDNFSLVSKEVIKDFSSAIVMIKEDASQSINDAGRGLEDFLRIDLAKDIDLSKCSGIIQITNELNKKPEDYPTKLNNVCLSLGSIRSMGKAHGADKALNERWAIKPETVKNYIIMILSLINSYLEYKQNKKLIF